VAAVNDLKCSGRLRVGRRQRLAADPSPKRKRVGVYANEHQSCKRPRASAWGSDRAAQFSSASRRLCRFGFAASNPLSSISATARSTGQPNTPMRYAATRIPVRWKPCSQCTSTGRRAGSRRTARNRSNTSAGGNDLSENGMCSSVTPRSAHQLRSLRNHRPRSGCRVPPRATTTVFSPCSCRIVSRSRIRGCPHRISTPGSTTAKCRNPS
jgi:hypothetical protein